MTSSPIANALDELLEQLRKETARRSECEQKIAECARAIRGLIEVCPEKDDKAKYVELFQELTEKPGFLSAIRSVLREHPEWLTRKKIKNLIVLKRKMRLSDYSNPLASINTTLERMIRSGEIEDRNDSRERLYRLVREKR